MTATQKKRDFDDIFNFAQDYPFHSIIYILIGLILGIAIARKVFNDIDYDLSLLFFAVILQLLIITAGIAFVNNYLDSFQGGKSVARAIFSGMLFLLAAHLVGLLYNLLSLD